MYDGSAGTGVEEQAPIIHGFQLQDPVKNGPRRSEDLVYLPAADLPL